MFYIEECTVEESDLKDKGNEKLHKETALSKCLEIQQVFQKVDSKIDNKGRHNSSVKQCVKIISEMTSFKKKEGRKSSCRFNPSNFLPWVHSVTFSLMTIGKQKIDTFSLRLRTAFY